MIGAITSTGAFWCGFVNDKRLDAQNDCSVLTTRISDSLELSARLRLEESGKSKCSVTAQLTCYEVSCFHRLNANVTVKPVFLSRTPDPAVAVFRPPVPSL